MSAHTREIADLGVEGAGSVWAGTLHGLCFSILQRAEVLAATGRVARPLASCEERFLRQDLSELETSDCAAGALAQKAAVLFGGYQRRKSLARASFLA